MYEYYIFIILFYNLIYLDVDTHAFQKLHNKKNN